MSDPTTQDLQDRITMLGFQRDMLAEENDQLRQQLHAAQVKRSYFNGLIAVVKKIFQQ